MKHVLVTGGSGLIGSALVRDLIGDGHSVTILTRSPAKVRERFPDRTHAVSALEDIPADQHIDQVVNLAGEQIVGKRWTNDRKRRIRESRIDLTRDLVAFLQSRERAPEVLISGSAIGYYGDRGNDRIDESATPAEDFGARLCVEWEQEAEHFASNSTRVCLIRTGLVLSKKGGMLEQMLLPFKMGLGARIGNGKQWMSWIHLRDEVRAIRFLLDQGDLEGAFNLTAPEPVTNRTFTEQLAAALNRPAFLFIPGIAVKLGLGEAATLLLGGQRVLPKKLLEAGFEFDHPAIKGALEDIVA